MLSTGGGEGGRHEERDWEGNLVWAFDLNTSTNMSHHDFKVLPNGNLIMIVCEVKTLADVIAAGFNTNLCVSAITTTGGFMLPDYIAEVQPTRPYGRQHRLGMAHMGSPDPGLRSDQEQLRCRQQ